VSSFTPTCELIHTRFIGDQHSGLRQKTPEETQWYAISLLSPQWRQHWRSPPTQWPRDTAAADITAVGITAVDIMVVDTTAVDTTAVDIMAVDMDIMAAGTVTAGTGITVAGGAAMASARVGK
jgi:hypothetical protein